MPEKTSKASQPLHGTNHCFKTWSSNCKDMVSAAKLDITVEEPDPRDRERFNRFGSVTRYSLALKRTALSSAIFG